MAAEDFLRSENKASTLRRSRYPQSKALNDGHCISYELTGAENIMLPQDDKKTNKQEFLFIPL